MMRLLGMVELGRMLLESNDIVTGLDRGYAFAYGFDDPGTFVAEDYWKSAFRVLSRQRVCI